MNRKIFIIISAAVILAALAFGVYHFGQKAAGRSFFAGKSPLRETASSPSFQKVSERPLDSDGDGLSDEEEKDLGTSPYKVDSDGDGLFDREEVRVYLTDPLVLDTDGDGFSDGEEVGNGDNPKGEGKLLDFQAAVKEIGKEKS